MIKMTKRFVTALVGLVLLSVMAEAAMAIPLTFDFLYSGAPNGNSATASGYITFKDGLPQNPTVGSTSYYFGANDMLAFSMIVSGASSGNGTYSIGNFSQIYWSTNGATLDLTSQLVGQTVSPGHLWGTGGDSLAGDFNVFGSTPSAPYGTYYFQLTTNGGAGDMMNLTSFAPQGGSAVPEPGTIFLMCGGLLGFAVFGKIRMNKV